jgi:hypothetical protein
MTPKQFRKLALALPHASESSHMGTADFRVGTKIFATLGNPDPAYGVVALTADQQALFVETNRKAFAPVPGAWGSRGWTRVFLAAVDATALRRALTLAWEGRAPKTLRGAAATAPRKPAARPIASFDRVFARVRKAARASKLPEIEEGTWYGTPALLRHGKGLMRVKDADTLVFRCTLEEKALLIEAEPAVYFETDHYAGWGAVLVRAAAASDKELRHCVTRAWRMQEPEKPMAGRTRPATKSRAGRKTAQ